MRDSCSVADRLKALPPYLFAEIDRAKKELVEKGVDVIDLGVGDPDLPTPEPIIEALKEAAADPANHRYALNEGLPLFRKAAADWFAGRFGINLNPETGVLPLIGSKEGIGHFPLAFVNPGDLVLIPEPAYPVFRSGTIFAGGEPFYLSLKADHGFLPDLDAIPTDVLDRAVIWFINYPNNPTSATASRDFFQRVVDLARRHQIILASDAAYSEIFYSDDRPGSILEIPGADEIAIEFHSLSKTFNMTGWRIGFAVGASPLLKGLGAIKANLDSGIFQAIQVAGARALSLGDSLTSPLRDHYRRRRDLMIDALHQGGFKIDPPSATFYLWVPLPEGLTSAEVAGRLLREAGVVVTPGSGFGPSGEGYIRLSLTVPDQRIEEAASRLAALSW